MLLKNTFTLMIKNPYKRLYIYTYRILWLVYTKTKIIAKGLFLPSRTVILVTYERSYHVYRHFTLANGDFGNLRWKSISHLFLAFFYSLWIRGLLKFINFLPSRTVIPVTKMMVSCKNSCNNHVYRGLIHSNVKSQGEKYTYK